MSENDEGELPLTDLMREAFRGEKSGESADPPQQFGRFSVREKLGQGGMGDVFIAFDETLQRRVALKTIRSIHRLNVETQVRFLREARILSQLDHPNICRIHDYVRGDEVDVLVLELIEGQSLGEHMRSGVTRVEALRIATELVDALSAAHAAGVVHRDLKPANVMITPEGQVKVLDFGIARSMSSDEIEATDEGTQDSAETGTQIVGLTGLYQTLEGSILGTVAYMSPEQAHGKLVTAASDLYAFGLIFQELLTGVAIQPRGLTVNELLRRAREGIHEPMTSRSAAGARIGKDLVRLIGDLESVTPKDRPSASTTHERLRAIAGKPQRRMKQLAATILVALAIGASVKYTFDLEHERSLAVTAMNEADLRRGQAEELIDNVVGTLRGQLQPLGRLDLLEDVGVLAQNYFASVPEDTLTANELRRRSQTLYQLGEVEAASGDLAASHALSEQSLRLARKHVEADPSDADWLFELGQSEFYVGAALRDQGHTERARQHWQHYLDVSEQLAALDPTNDAWQIELAWARTNLAVLDLEQGDAVAAEAIFGEVLTYWDARAAEHPDDQDTQVELADILSWSAESLLAQNEWERTIELLKRERDIRIAVLEHEPDVAEWKRRLSTTHNKLAVAHNEIRTHSETALTNITQALELSGALTAQDPRNAEWLREHGMNLLMIAKATPTDDPRGAGAAREASRIFEYLSSQDRSNVEWRMQSAKVDISVGYDQLDRGDLDGALASAERAMAQLEDSAAAGPRPRHAIVNALRLAGNTLAQLGDEARARAAWQRGVDIFERGTLAAPLQVRDLELLIECLIRLENRDAATGHLEALVALGPITSPTLIELCLTHAYEAFLPSPPDEKK